MCPKSSDASISKHPNPDRTPAVAQAPSSEAPRATRPPPQNHRTHPPTQRAPSCSHKLALRRERKDPCGVGRGPTPGGVAAALDARQLGTAWSKTVCEAREHGPPRARQIGLPFCPVKERRRACCSDRDMPARHVCRRRKNARPGWVDGLMG